MFEVLLFKKILSATKTSMKRISLFCTYTFYNPQLTEIMADVRTEDALHTEVTLLYTSDFKKITTDNLLRLKNARGMDRETEALRCHRSKPHYDHLSGGFLC